MVSKQCMAEIFNLHGVNVLVVYSVKKRVFLTGITVLIRKEKWQLGKLMTFLLI